MLSSPASIANQSISLWAPACFVYVFLVLASLFALVSTGSSTVSSLRQQIFSWWYLLFISTAALYFYPYGIPILVLLICGLTARELDHHVHHEHWLFHLICTITLCLSFSLNYFSSRWFFILLPSLLLAQWMVFYLKRKPNQLLSILFTLTCFGIGVMIQYLKLPLKENTLLFWLAYLLVITAFNDVAQFICGRCFGKQKIASQISPNKTWQGLFGGIFISTLLSIAFGQYLQLGGILFLALLGFLMSLGGFSGDMLFSAAKRFLGIKDFSTLIPGHGGILDRIDSLVVTAPLLYLILHITSQAD
jgi:phosphatidate cytidylyltransferase